MREWNAVLPPLEGDQAVDPTIRTPTSSNDSGRTSGKDVSFGRSAAQLSATVRPVDGYISWFDRVVSCASVHCCRSSRLLHGYRRGSMANRWSRTAGARVVIRDAASAMRTFDLRQRRGHWVSGLEGRPLVSRARRSKRGSRLPDHILAVSVVRMAFGLFSARTSPKVAGIVPIDLGGVLRVISRRVCKAEENMD
jgi:hypothetical protein